MSDTSIEYFRRKGLLPWQIDFVYRFLKDDKNQYYELVAPNGVGKTHLAKILVAHELGKSANKRVLVLTDCPSIWQSHLLSILSKFESEVISPLVVDRKTYLELESKVPVGHTPWPIPAIILMDIYVAKREDMTEKLGDANWDLLVFDDFNRNMQGLFDKLIESGAIHRALLLSHEINPSFDEKVTYVRITDKDLMDRKGRPLFDQTEKELIELHYNRTKEEKVFLNELEKLPYLFGERWGLGKLLEKSILAAASSSIYATEVMLLNLQNDLRLLRNKVAHSMPLTNEDVEQIQQNIFGKSGVKTIDELPIKSRINTKQMLVCYYQKLELLLKLIEEIPSDPKMDALLKHIAKYKETGDQTRLCIVSLFNNTLQYLHSSIQDLEIPVYSLTNVQEYNERKEAIEAFQKKGGLLIATDASLEGVDLEKVTECINYDLPINMQRLEERLGRFSRFGRKSKIRMVIFRDQSRTLRWEENILKGLIHE